MKSKAKKKARIKMTQKSIKSKFEILIENYKQLNVTTVIFNIFKLNLNILLFFSLTSFIVNSIEAKQVVGPSPNVMINSVILGIIISIIWLIYYAGFGEYGIPTSSSYVNREEFNYVALEYYQKVSSLYDNIWKIVKRIHNLISIFSITMLCYLLQYQNLNKDLFNTNEFLDFRERKNIACIILLMMSTFIPLSKKYLNQLVKELKQKFQVKFFAEFELFLDKELFIQNTAEYDDATKKRNNHIKGLIEEAYIGLVTLTSYGFVLNILYENAKKLPEVVSRMNETQTVLIPIMFLLMVTPGIVSPQMYEDC